ncbi:MAG: response regulator [Saccharofermentanales bacterium]
MDNKYILLVEDNEDDVTLTEIAFKKVKISYDLITVSNGQEALDFLYFCGKYINRPTQENPSIILLDLKLPFVSGLDVLKEIRANKSTTRIPVLVLTSSIEEKDHIEAVNLGTNEFILKPTSYTDFIEILQHIKNDWLL